MRNEETTEGYMRDEEMSARENISASERVLRDEEGNILVRRASGVYQP